MTNLELREYYSVNFDKLVKRIYRSCGNFHDAEDIVQEAFERALKYKETCKEVDKWFNTILRNTYKDYIKRIMSWPITKPLEDSVSDLEPIITNDMQLSTISLIFKEVSKEPEPNATVLYLHINLGYTSGEISHLMENLSAKKIDNIISYFKRKLIKSLQ